MSGHGKVAPLRRACTSKQVEPLAGCPSSFATPHSHPPQKIQCSLVSSSYMHACSNSEAVRGQLRAVRLLNISISTLS